jgi:glycosyltransferase involved in cell wall biosynthesis
MPRGSELAGEVVRALSVNGKFLAQRTTGVQRYAAELVRAWDDGLRDGWIDRARYSIRVYAPQDTVGSPDYCHVEVVRCSSKGRVWEQIELPWRAKRTLLYSPFAAAPVAAVRHAVTIHDAGVAATPQQYSAGFRIYYQLVYRMLARRCDPIVTVSEFSRSELGRYFSIPQERIKVIPPGCDYLQRVPPDAAILSRFGLVKGRYVLGVSSQSVIKNFEGLQKAWMRLARPDMKLAIAGGSNTYLFGKGAQTLAESHTVLLGYVSDSELRALYENAALFAYPSFYEGFGLPPVEAMTCGCPVLVANSSALPEVCGDAAVYCNPRDVVDIADKMSTVLDNPQLAETLQKRGKLHSAKFTTQRTASLLWSAILEYL